MSARSRWGTLNTITGTTACEFAQERTDIINAEIHRPAKKIDIMSDEEWNRKMEEGKKRWEEEQAREVKERTEKRLAKEQALQPRRERVEREKKYPKLIEEKLGTYHEPAGEEEYSEANWKPIYKQTSPFLAKCVLAYRYGMERDSGRLADADLDYYGGRNLVEYLHCRDIPPSTDETGLFEILLSKKLEFPKFLSVALSANIETLSKDNSLAETVDLLEFILADYVTQTEITELVLE